MITAVSISNFQTHQNLDVDFDPKITTIAGPTDAGKSSLLRAIRWVCLNTPDGMGFVREGQKEAAVLLSLDEIQIQRKRGKGENSYVVDGLEKKSFGKSVPDSAASKLCVDEVNFQDQYDAPFWISLSSAEVARRLNSIVDLEIIDRSAKKIARKVSESRVLVKVTREVLVKARQDKRDLQWVEDADVEFKRVEALDSSFRRKRQAVENLTRLVRETTRCQLLYEKGKQKRRDIVVLGKKAKEVLGSRKRIRDLETIIQSVKEKKEILDKPVFSVCSLQDCIVRFQGLSERFSSLSRVINRIQAKKKALRLYGIQVQEALETIEEKTGGRCPVCGKEMESGE